MFVTLTNIGALILSLRSLGCYTGNPLVDGGFSPIVRLH